MRFIRGLLYALVLILIGLASALTAMRFAIHGREVVVPKVVGLAPAEAQRLAANNGLTLVREQRFYSSEVGEGLIVSQLPAAGTRVRAGFRLRIAESLGPQKAEIPNLLAQSTRTAELNLRRRGLEMGSVAQWRTADFPSDQVIAQNPAPEAKQLATPAVNLLFSSPADNSYMVMPELTGLTLSEATAAIRTAGLKLGPVASTPHPRSDPEVIRQTPAPGQRVSSDTTVDLEIGE